MVLAMYFSFVSKMKRFHVCMGSSLLFICLASGWGVWLLEAYPAPPPPPATYVAMAKTSTQNGETLLVFDKNPNGETWLLFYKMPPSIKIGDKFNSTQFSAVRENKNVIRSIFSANTH
jgi:hypothetical protein